MENKWGGTTVSKHAYGYDELSRRTRVARSGTAFDDTLGTGGDDHFESWGYNDRNELTAALRFLGSDPNASSPTGVAELDRLFEYDPIGNRRTYRAGADPNDVLHYCVNGLNQYEDTGADASCDPPVEVFTHDLDGNLLSDGAFAYFWDAENRLKRVEAKSPSTSADKRVKFRYDYLGRRVEKVVFAWDPNAGMPVLQSGDGKMDQQGSDRGRGWMESIASHAQCTLNVDRPIRGNRAWWPRRRCMHF